MMRLAEPPNFIEGYGIKPDLEMYHNLMNSKAEPEVGSITTWTKQGGQVVHKMHIECPPSGLKMSHEVIIMGPKRANLYPRSY